MQNLARASVNGIGGPYTAAQVLAALTAATGAEQWICDRLSAAGAYLGDLTQYLIADGSGRVEHDTTRDVKRSLQCTFRGSAPLNVLHDFVRVHHQLAMSDGGLIDFSLGTFTMLPSQGSIYPSRSFRPVTGADPSQLLVDGAFTSSTGFGPPMTYVQAVLEVVNSLGSPSPLQVAIPDPGTVMAAPLAWNAGESRLKAVIDLLGAINYFPPWWDDWTLRSSPIPDWNNVAAATTFDCTQTGSFARIPLTPDPDLSQVFNTCVLSVEASSRPQFAVTYTNNDPASPVSVQNWHAKTVKVTDSSIPDAATALAKARALTQAAGRWWSPLVMDTASWPASQDNDVYRVIYQAADEPLSAALYVEADWTHMLAVGGPTTHRLYRIYPS